MCKNDAVSSSIPDAYCSTGCDAPFEMAKKLKNKIKIKIKQNINEESLTLTPSAFLVDDLGKKVKHAEVEF